MKLSIVLVVSGAALAHANEHRMMRGFGRGGGGQGGGGRGGGGGGGGGRGGGRFGGGMMKGNCYWGADDGQPLFDRIQEECDTNFSCSPGVEELQCDRWETLDDDGILFEGCPEEGLTEEQKEEMRAKREEMREKWMSMTLEERAEHREQKEAVRAANAATVLGCGCCEGMDSIEALVKGREGAVAKALGFRKPMGEGGHGFGHGYGHGHGHGWHHGGGGRPGATGQGNAAGGDGDGD